MKARLIALLSLVLAVALLAGGLPALASQATAVDLNVTQADAGRQVTLDQNHILAVSLDANPSTGYGWQIAGEQKLLTPVHDEFVNPSGLLGATGKQILRFKANAAGQTTLNLVYSRPWEKAAPEKTFSINVVAKGALALPYKAPVAQTPTQIENSVNIPTDYNWCGSYCTGVRNQGSCGSCWAFSTVGALESHLLIYHGINYNASEQYLVSCNGKGYSCSGGWYAHEYHYNTYIVGESGPGSVSEASFPYQAANVACNPPHTHNYLISGWANLCGTSSICSVSSVTNAIYNYGPVSAAVYVGSAFQAYTSGIFSTSQNGSVNHAIVLTGYNGTNQYYNLRNSWGTTWGESGYMRIRYGTSSIGYRTTYVW